MLLAVGDTALDAQLQVVVMSNGPEEYTQDHGSQSESKHLTCSPRSSDLSGTVPLDETNHSSQDERRRGRLDSACPERLPSGKQPSCIDHRH